MVLLCLCIKHKTGYFSMLASLNVFFQVLWPFLMSLKR